MSPPLSTCAAMDPANHDPSLRNPDGTTAGLAQAFYAHPWDHGRADGRRAVARGRDHVRRSQSHRRPDPHRVALARAVGDVRLSTLTPGSRDRGAGAGGVSRGRFEAAWNGKVAGGDAPAGIYFVRPRGGRDGDDAATGGDALVRDASPSPARAGHHHLVRRGSVSPPFFCETGSRGNGSSGLNRLCRAAIRRSPVRAAWRAADLRRARAARRRASKSRAGRPPRAARAPIRHDPEQMAQAINALRVPATWAVRGQKPGKDLTLICRTSSLSPPDYLPSGHPVGANRSFPRNSQRERITCIRSPSWVPATSDSSPAPASPTSVTRVVCVDT